MQVSHDFMQTHDDAAICVAGHQKHTCVGAQGFFTVNCACDSVYIFWSQKPRSGRVALCTCYAHAHADHGARPDHKTTSQPQEHMRLARVCHDLPK